MTILFMIFVNGARGVSYHAFEKTPQQWQEIEREQIKIQSSASKQKSKPEPKLEPKQEKRKEEKPKKFLWWRLLLVILFYIRNG